MGAGISFRRHVPLALMIACAICAQGMAGADQTVQFNRDVRPILSMKCYPCHGPDANTRKREIRFDVREELFGKTLDGVDLLAPGKPDESELFRRVIAPNSADLMPPAEAKLELSAQEVATLRAWIEQGAAWEGHWAFIPPTKPAIPEVSNAVWPRNEIDYFILRQLDAAGLAPSEEADKATLLRRVSFDLTGLPPTPAEVDAFEADTSESAYEKVVDRLLASPHYGERMSFPWLDAARYSDTNGYQRDTIRIMWPWRDWVIQAFNDNMPYDQFTIEQLAGDLLPNATLSQKIATGFNRNHRINGEGGIIPEEYAVEYVADRVSTTSTAFMGITMECARCHDHKYDPFTQKEFYELFSYFNQVPEEGKGREQGNDKPFVEVPTPEQEAQKAVLSSQLASLEQLLNGPDARLDALQAAWEQAQQDKFATLGWQAIDVVEAVAANSTVLEKQPDLSVLASGPTPENEVYTLRFTAPAALGALKLEALTDPSLPHTGPGRAANGNVVLSGVELERKGEALNIANAFADHAQPGGDFGIRNAIDADPATGWATDSPDKREKRSAIFVLDPAVSIQPGEEITLRLRHESEHTAHALGRFRLSASPSRAVAKWAAPALGAWDYLGLIPSDAPNNELISTPSPAEEGYDPARSYGDGALKWVEKPEWADGQVIIFDTKDKGFHYLHRKIQVEAATSVTLSLGSNDAIKVWLNGIEKFSNNVGRGVGPDQDRVTLFLEEGSHDLMLKIANYGGESAYYFQMVDDGGQGLLKMMDLLATPAAERNPESQRMLTTLFRERDAEWTANKAAAAKVREELAVLAKEVITTMVMEDMETPRDTFLLLRGVYDKPDTSEKLFPSTPAVLGEQPEYLPKNRLGLAQWLVDPQHPLTARVRVNHYWQMYFGRGIVKTSEDFGIQGAPPTHPDLLDWLAVDFIESSWDVKRFQKRIVMSATYRQSSRQTELHQEKDPQNLLLARMPRLRLPAEAIRDQALAVSGLLTPTIGGPSVKPYQPAELWSALTFQSMDEYDTNFYEQDTGEKLYRRGLYTYWKRTILPPHMQIFNAAGREMCSMRQENTNTPMQALTLLNDITFVEATRFLGQRMILEGGARSADRIRYGFKLLFAQAPTPEKEQVLMGALNDYQAHYYQHPDEAAKLLKVGEGLSDASIPEPELAAYALLASVMLNTDQAITRE